MRTAYVLAIVLPSVGGHQLYLGHKKRAAAYIFCTCLSITGILLARYYLKHSPPEEAKFRLHLISVMGVITTIVVNIMFIRDLLAIPKEVRLANARFYVDSTK